MQHAKTFHTIVCTSKSEATVWRRPTFLTRIPGLKRLKVELQVQFDQPITSLLSVFVLIPAFCPIVFLGFFCENQSQILVIFAEFEISWTPFFFFCRSQKWTCPGKRGHMVTLFMKLLMAPSLNSALERGGQDKPVQKQC